MVFYDLEGSEAELGRKAEIKTQGKRGPAVAPSPPANAASLMGKEIRHQLL